MNIRNCRQGYDLQVKTVEDKNQLFYTSGSSYSIKYVINICLIKAITPDNEMFVQ